ncbi:aldehyde dehydrogenase (NAD(P)(+)) ald5 [Ascosphaera aggregata]|nr:aldehyde dehydrogenase (NAD(P)(+)) ald5 [Ascosphaera aggregata]
MELTQKLQAGRFSYDQPLGLFINNKFFPSVDGATFETTSPHTEELICRVHEASPNDVDLAVAAARSAKEGPWKHIPASDRGKLLTSLANLFDENQELLASIETLDNGKSLQLAMAGSPECLWLLASLDYTRVEPVGVFAPAIATGNCVVVKSSELSPLSALFAAGLVVKAGFPPGVINVISGFGSPTGSALTAHMDIDKVAFTGSTAVGRKILEACARSNLKKVTLELGGKSPNIVFGDADLETAASWVNHGIYFNQGQCCSAGSRILVQEEVYDRFLEIFKKKAASNKVGDPFEMETFHGPQISERQFKRILDYIEQGKKAGATCELGGKRIGDKGYYIEPTIFTNVSEKMTIVKEEIFGPVCVVQKFNTEEEAIKLANGTAYGLAGAVHTKNLNTAVRVSNALKAGTVWINSYNLLSYQMPFGGFKDSGFGRELGQHALDNYTQVKSVRIDLTET